MNRVELWGAVMTVGLLLLIPAHAFSPSPNPFAPAHASALSPLVPRGFVPTPQSSHVNPFALISHEPAPMGMADFGVSGVTGNVQAYSYSSSSFEGNVDVRSMLTTAPGAPSTYAHYMTFQLNTVVVFGLNGTNYSYWIQDVVSIDSSTRFFGMIDNIWNLSGSSAALNSAELQGNGTVNNGGGFSWYADSPSSTSYPGNLVYLTWPTTISVRTVESRIGGLPHVGFEYNDGYGWVTFDNATFRHMGAATDYGFVVNGYAYTPIGIFYDAEWDYAGSGSGQYNNYSNLNMSLEYWNGHNWQIPANAWNFGSDTAESLSNVISASGPAPPDGRLYSHLTNGSGTLGLLYNATDVALLNVSSPTLSAGLITVNGTAHAFVGGSANLTLAPGTYSIGLYNGTQFIDSTSLTLAPGSYTPLSLPIPRIPLRFSETGLPTGTNWSVTLNGVSESSRTPWINFTERNGSYAFSLGHVAGYVTPTSRGSVPIAGQPVTVSIRFFPFNFTVTFQNLNLLAGTPWSVAVDGGANVSSTGSSLTVAVPNGTHTYAVSTIYAFVGDPPNGSFQVRGFGPTIDITFAERLGTLSGSLNPATAILWINGAQVSTSGGNFSFSETPDTYMLEATAPGYLDAFQNVTVTAGNSSYANFTLNVVPPPAAGTGGLLSNPFLWAGVVGIAAIAIGVAVVLRRRRSPPPPE